MAKAKQGDRVRFNFLGKLEDGTVFDTTYDDGECDDNCSDENGEDCGDDCGCEHGPMEIEIGAEDFFPQVEQALIGMAPGEKKTVTIAYDDAFGDYDEEKVFTVGRDQFPDNINPEVGEDLELTGDDGEEMIVTVIEIEKDEVTLDANHPLAGEDLIFEIELLEIL